MEVELVDSTGTIKGTKPFHRTAARSGRGSHMTDSRLRSYCRISKAKQLHDEGIISDGEFATLKATALS